MAGAAQELSLEELAQWADAQASAWQNPDFRKPLEICKVLVGNSIKDNFKGAHDPEGTAWPPLKQPRQQGQVRKGSGGTRRSKSTSHPLWDTGRLMMSTGAGEGHVESVSHNELIYGTNLVYAGIHNFGGTINVPAWQGTKARAFTGPDGRTIFTRKTRAHTVTIPQRMFVGVGEKLADDCATVFMNWTGEQMGS
jgi:phage gpG-like protein